MTTPKREPTPAPVLIPYLRQSQGRDGENEDNSLSLEAQEREIHAWAIKAGYSHVEDAVRDWDRSGVDPYREGLLELRSRVKPGTVVAVWRWDRLGRKVTLSESMIDALEELGATVVSVTQGSDRFARQVYGVMAESEYRAHSARMITMKRTVAMRGGFKGGSPPYGYRQAERYETRDEHGVATTHQRGPLVPYEPEAEIVREIFARIVRGEGTTAIASDLAARGIPTKKGGAWNTSAIRRLALRPVYIGQVSHHGDVVAVGVHEPLVDESTWQAARAILTNPSRPRAVQQHGSDLATWAAGYVVHSCGAPMYAVTEAAKRVSYVVCADRACRLAGRHMAAPKISAFARRCLSADLGAIVDVESAISRARELAGATEVAKERAKLEAQLAEAERIYDRARAWYVQSSQELEWMQEQLARYESVRKEVGGKLAQLPAEPDRAEYEIAWQQLRSLGESFAMATAEDLRALLVQVGVVEIGVERDTVARISIRYRPPYRDLIPHPYAASVPRYSHTRHLLGRG